MVMPLVSLGTSTARYCDGLSCERATTTRKRPKSLLVENALCPLSTSVSPSRRTVVVIRASSLPASCSLPSVAQKPPVAASSPR